MQSFHNSRISIFYLTSEAYFPSDSRSATMYTQGNALENQHYIASSAQLHRQFAHNKRLSISTYALPVMRSNDRAVRFAYNTANEILKGITKVDLAARMCYYAALNLRTMQPESLPEQRRYNIRRA